MISKKGFSSVFLTMVFGSMIMLTFAFINISSMKAMESSCNAVFSLAGQSILSEFDLTLKEKYGLIAFGLDNKEIENRLLYYGNSTFKNRRVARLDSFFKDEVEYILYGKFNDAENKSKFKSDFIKFRMALNLAHIYTDDIKVREITALANVLTPGPAAIGTQGIIAAAWAYTESLNDAKLLDAGKEVALIKRRENWAIDINSYDSIKDGMIEPSGNKGYSYEDYLKIFIYLEDREIKLLRIMDLIQINLIGNYDNGFLIRNCFSGFEYSVTANEKKFYYEEKY